MKENKYTGPVSKPKTAETIPAEKSFDYPSMFKVANMLIAEALNKLGFWEEGQQSKADDHTRFDKLEFEEAGGIMTITDNYSKNNYVVTKKTTYVEVDNTGINSGSLMGGIGGKGKLRIRINRVKGKIVSKKLINTDGCDIDDLDDWVDSDGIEALLDIIRGSNSIYEAVIEIVDYEVVKTESTSLPTTPPTNREVENTVENTMIEGHDYWFKVTTNPDGSVDSSVIYNNLPDTMFKLNSEGVPLDTLIRTKSGGEYK